MKILNGTEQMLFDRPPQLSGAERRHIFELPVAIWSAAHEIQSASGRIGFLVSAGYFRSARRFFPAADFYERDIAYAAVRLNIDTARFDHAVYPARTRQRHRLQFWNYRASVHLMATPRGCSKQSWRRWPSLIPAQR